MSGRINKLLHPVWMIVLFSFLPLKAQNNDSNFRILIETGGGLGISTDTLTKPGDRYGLAGFFRIMVKPDHLLRFGVETGLLRIASFRNGTITNEFGTSNVNATLRAIPVMLVFSMYVKELYLNTGLGYYYVTSSISAFGESVSDTRWNIGFYLSLDYRFHIAENLDLLPEIRWCSIGELGKTLLLAQVGLSYSVLEW